ncbi:MAG: flagellin [Phycisphaerae bacterium]|jgi:flagellin
MSRINTNIQSLVAQRVLVHQTNELNTSLYRLSTGYRINTGKDDPAGLIASENLRAEKTAIQSALTNITRANNVVASAEGGLVEINKLLLELEDLVDRSANEAGISVDERDANQLQIDTILDSINRIANSTEFQGRKLLSGDLGYTTSGVVTASNYFQNVTINAAKIPNGGFRTVTVQVTGSANLAELTFAGTEIVGTGSGNSVTFQVTGALGTEVLTFGSGTSLSEVQTAINQSTGLTGVSATISADSSGLRINSTQYGSSQFVRVKVLDNGGTNFESNLSMGDQGDHVDAGRDASVKINGVQAITDGLQASMRTQALSVDITLTAEFGTLGNDPVTATALNQYRAFDITGGGADFMISPTAELAGLASLGIQAVDTGSLGDGQWGFLSSIATGQTNSLSSGNYSTAQTILRAAQSYVAQLRGRLGAFQKDTLETTANSLQVTLENTAAAESVIRDTDFASETSALTRAQILQQSATNVLRLANAAPQNALNLLG